MSTVPLSGNQLEVPKSFGIAEMIREAKEHPAKPIITGLLCESETAGLHGPTEVFKTIFCLQLAESLATAKPLLGIWHIPKPLKVYFFETEMSVSALGKRLLNMFDGEASPQGIQFANEEQLKQFRRAVNLDAKFGLLNQWVSQAQADLTIVDTVNPMFRGQEKPNDETAVGRFFDLLSMLPSATKLFVRHDRKPREEDVGCDETAAIRGSGQFSDVPDLLLKLRRTDKRTNEARFLITKYRHGSKPEPLPVWFDSGDFRLISVPPVIHLLKNGPRTREELLTGLGKRFDLSHAAGDAQIKAVNDYLLPEQRGHEKVYDIDRQAAKAASWFRTRLLE